MRWMGSRRTSLAGLAAERRLRELAGPWRPGPGDGERALGGAGADGIDAVPAPGRWPESGSGDGRGIRLGPWSRRAVRGLILLIAVTVALAAYVAWQASPRAVVEAPEILAVGVVGTADSPATSLGPATVGAAPPAPLESSTPEAATGDVVVHVAGLVARPGLVRLPAGSRVADAVTAAGGVTRRRASDTVNLARILVDGEQIVVADPESVVPGQAASSPGSPAVLDLNAATAEALDSLPGVGPVLASRIVSWRTSNGPFRTVDELAEVSGIGEAVLSQVRPLVRV